MNYEKIEIKKGIQLHKIETNKFKTNLLSVFISIPLSKEEITKQALIPAVLRRGNMKYKTSEEINIKLEEMYGATFDCGIEKTGNNHIIKIYLETINDEFLPQKEDILKNGIDQLMEIAFNPLVENGAFKKEYVEVQKQNLKNVIEGKKDNKTKYALDRCIEEMYKDKVYGLYKFGYVEDLENIDEKNLYECYKKLIKNAKIDIFVSGKNIKKSDEIIKNNENIQKLEERVPDFIKNSIDNIKNNTPKVVQESMNIAQGKLVIGLTIDDYEQKEKFIAIVYNAILGGTPTSKMFQNVREKASLAYTATSNYLKQKNNIFIRCGIEIKNYDRALEIIKQQLEDMRSGKFTDEDIKNAKSSIISTIKFIPDEQDTEITYYFGQEFNEKFINFEEYINEVNKVTKQEIIDLAKKIEINTIYFLKD